VYDNETLIRGFALAYAKNKNLLLTLKGDGPLVKQVRDLVDTLGLSAVVTFKEKTAYSDVPTDYRAADIFITSSISDGTPVSILEAMASGLPCIATVVGGIPEWVEDGVTGLLIRPRDPDAVASAIQILASDPELRTLIGSALRQVILKNSQ
jgi:glycosyltransferase involved in cell wall biosynthesis